MKCKPIFHSTVLSDTLMLGLVLSLGSVSVKGYAFDREASVSLETEYDRNATRQVERRSNSALRGIFETRFSKPSGFFQAEGELEVAIEKNTAFDDAIRPEGIINAEMEFLPQRFRWVFSDIIEQTLNSPLANDNVDNLNGSNIFSTGPDFTLRLGRRNTLVLSARYDRQDTQEDSGLSDSERLSHSTTLEHRFNTLWSSSLGYSFSDNRAQDRDREVEQFTVGVNRITPRSEILWYMGTAEVSTQVDDTTIGVFDYNFRISPRLNFLLRYEKSVQSDIENSINFQRDRRNDIRFLAGDCARTISSGAVGCSRLPSVTAREVSGSQDNKKDVVFDLAGSSRKDLTTDDLVETFSRFDFSNSLFEDEVLNVGFFWQSPPHRFTFDYAIERYTAFVDSDSILNSPDELESRVSAISVAKDWSKRFTSIVSYEYEEIEGLTVNIPEKRHTDLVFIDNNYTINSRLSLSGQISWRQNELNGSVREPDVRDAKANGVRFRLGVKYGL